MLVPVAIVIQVYCVLAFAFLPFGFDHQSSWGLDIGHFLYLVTFYAMTLMGGMMAALAIKWYPAVWLQGAGFPVAILLYLMGMEIQKSPYYYFY